MLDYHRVRGDCRPCGAIATISLITGVVLVIVFCVILFVYNLRGSDAASFPSLIIGLNALQIAAEYGRLSAAWPPLVKTVFGEC